MSLPDPRRVIIAHDTSTGAPIITDDVLPSAGPGQLARQAFVQTAIPGNPNEGVVGKDEKPDLGFVRQGGVSVAYLDFAPGQAAPMHYTTSIDYLVVLFGEFELSAHDGTTKKLGPGDLIVQLAAAHSSKNVGDGPARLLAISLPSEEVKINGKTISESGIKAMKLF